MEKYESNREIIETRWPNIWEAISQSELHYRCETALDTPDDTLVFSGIHLTSAYNRASEARLQAKIIDQNAEIATVYGFGLGDLPRVLLERRTLRNLRVVIMNPAIVKTVIGLFDQSDWLGDNRVTLLLARNANQVEKPFAVCPASLRLASEEAARARDSVVLELEKSFQEKHFRDRKQELDDKLKASLPFVREDGDVSTLFNTAQNKIGVVVAAGPSAEEMFDWIRQNRNKLSVVAVSTSLLPLEKNGIQPDVVIAVDPHIYLENHFLNADLDALRRVPFVYVPVVCKEMLVLWKGPRLVAYTHRPRFEALASQIPRGFLYCSGTVTHAAVDLSIKMGAQKILLVGVDFCFPEGISHVQGASPAHKIDKGTYVHPWAINGQGERVMSNTAMIGYLRDLEQYIKLQANTQFFNTGRAGAKIEGATWLEGKALDDFCA